MGVSIFLIYSHVRNGSTHLNCLRSANDSAQESSKGVPKPFSLCRLHGSLTPLNDPLYLNPFLVGVNDIYIFSAWGLKSYESPQGRKNWPGQGSASFAGFGFTLFSFISGFLRID